MKFDLKPILSVAFAAVATPLHAAPPQPAIHDGLSAPAKVWTAAIETGDLAALTRMHGPDTVAYPPGQTLVRGGAEILNGYADLFAHYSVRVKSDDTHWIEQGPLVVSWGLTTLTLHPKNGGLDVVSRTRFTDAAVKTENGWCYIIDHASKQP